jgi:hypothetical protein
MTKLSRVPRGKGAKSSSHLGKQQQTKGGGKRKRDAKERRVAGITQKWMGEQQEKEEAYEPYSQRWTKEDDAFIRQASKAGVNGTPLTNIPGYDDLSEHVKAHAIEVWNTNRKLSEAHTGSGPAPSGIDEIWFRGGKTKKHRNKKNKTKRRR